MQGGILGSFCFLAFLLSLGKNTLGEAQNQEDLKTGLQDSPTLDDGGYKFNEDDSDDRSALTLLSGHNTRLYSNNYGTMFGSNPHSPFGSYNPGHNLGSSFGEADALSQTQAMVTGFGSNYASMAADANAQALAELNFHSSPYVSDYFGAGSSLTQAQIEAQANTNAQALAELTYHNSPYVSEYFGAGSNLAHSQAEAQANANIYGLRSFSPTTFNQGYGSNFIQTLDNNKIKDSIHSSSYTSSEADALAQSIALGMGYGGYGPGYLGPGSNVQYTPSDTHSFSTGFESNLNLAQANSHEQAVASGLGLSLSPGSSYNTGYLNSGLSSANADVYHTGTNLQSGLGLSPNSDNKLLHYGVYGPIASNLGSTLTEAQYTANVQNFANIENELNIAAANTFAGVNSWLIPDDLYVMPHIIPGGENVQICSKEGEFHNLWSTGFECLICACISQLGHLTPVCVKCDLCSVPTRVPPQPIPSFPPLPALIPAPEVSCDPLPTNTPFQNPLNPCQVCICQYSFGSAPDVRITCEESPTCVLPSDLTTIQIANVSEAGISTFHIVVQTAPISEPPAPVPLPVCERFPPNVVFPHPFDICKNCECIVSYTAQKPQHQIICQPTPECEAILPQSPKPSLDPGPLAWPPKPPGPLPGPSPHKSCAPYPPDQQFQHPWDQCQICVCNEIYSIGVVNIEVNCFSSPACCAVYPENQSQPSHIRDPVPVPVPVRETVPLPIPVVVDRPVPVPQPVAVPRPVPVLKPVPEPHLVSISNLGQESQAIPMPIREPMPLSVSQSHPLTGSALHPMLGSRPSQHHLAVSESYSLKLYMSCKGQEVGQEFLYNTCRMCTCQVFGNLLVPVCRRPNAPECDTLPAPVPTGNIVYIEPRCRQRPPLQSFTAVCLTCLCQSVFNYVMATCKPIPGCDASHQFEGASLVETAASMSSQADLSSLGYQYGSSDLLSSNDAAAFSGLSSGHGGYPVMSGVSGSYYADSETGANIQSGSSLYGLSASSNSYPYYGGQVQFNVDGETAASNQYPMLQLRPYGQITSAHRPGGVISHGLNFAKGIAESGIVNALGGFHGAGHYSGRPLIKSGNAEQGESEK